MASGVSGRSGYDSRRGRCFYVNGDPVNLVDPTGHGTACDDSAQTWKACQQGTRGYCSEGQCTSNGGQTYESADNYRRNFYATHGLPLLAAAVGGLGFGGQFQRNGRQYLRADNGVEYSVEDAKKLSDEERATLEMLRREYPGLQIEAVNPKDTVFPADWPTYRGARRVADFVAVDPTSGTLVRIDAENPTVGSDSLSAIAESVAGHTLGKSGQADVVVIDYGGVYNGRFSVENISESDAVSIAKDVSNRVLSTPSSVQGVIHSYNGQPLFSTYAEGFSPFVPDENGYFDSQVPENQGSMTQSPDSTGTSDETSADG